MIQGYHLVGEKPKGQGRGEKRFYSYSVLPLRRKDHQTGLVPRVTKLNSSTLYNLHPINHRLKHPILFDSLNLRILSLKFEISKYFEKNKDMTNHLIGVPYLEFLNAIQKMGKPENIYINAEKSRPKLNKDLKGFGGIYLWWCSQTGYFYIGSAKSLVGKNGRLNEYFQNNRLYNSSSFSSFKPQASLRTLRDTQLAEDITDIGEANTSQTNKKTGKTSAKLSRDIANDMIKYPKSFWNLIILYKIETDLIRKDKRNLYNLEQICMTLIPTYNRSLVVGSNEYLKWLLSQASTSDPTFKDKARVCNSNSSAFSLRPLDQSVENKVTIFIFEVLEGKLVFPDNNSQSMAKYTKVEGIKELSRTKLTHSKYTGEFSISQWDIKSYLESGLVYQDKFLLVNAKQNPDFNTDINLQKKWSAPAPDPLKGKKGVGLWVYKLIDTSLTSIPEVDLVDDRVDGAPSHVALQRENENFLIKGYASEDGSLEFIKYFKTVEECRLEYNISLSTFKRIRKHKSYYKGLFFSNVKLHK